MKNECSNCKLVTSLFSLSGEELQDRSLWTAVVCYTVVCNVFGCSLLGPSFLNKQCGCATLEQSYRPPKTIHKLGPAHTSGTCSLSVGLAMYYTCTRKIRHWRFLANLHIWAQMIDHNHHEPADIYDWHYHHHVMWCQLPPLQLFGKRQYRGQPQLEVQISVHANISHSLSPLHMDDR